MDDKTQTAVVEDSSFQKTMLVALNGGKKHIYAGTVPKHVVSRRRAKNKVAGASRRNNWK